MTADAKVTPPGALLARKAGMTQVFSAEGEAVAVTVLEAGPCTVVGVCTPARDGYAALRLGFDEVAPRKVDKPMKGVFQKAGVPPHRHIREVRVDGGEWKTGQVLRADVFQEGQFVDVSGDTIGRGFQGVVKRHGFTGGRSMHGSMFGRAPGSIGASTFPSRVWKGKRLPGHMGTARRTVQKLRVVRVDAERNVLLVAGSVPGSESGVLVVRATRKRTAFFSPARRPAPAQVGGKKAKTAQKKA